MIRMAVTRFALALVVLVTLAFGGVASADEGAQKFVEAEHVKLEALLR